MHIDGEDDDDAVVLDDTSADETVQDESEPPAPPSIEDLASSMGWTPKDSWRGSPDKWRPAHEFLRKTVDYNHNLKSSVDSLKAQIDNISRTSGELLAQRIEEERAKLRGEWQEAFEEGNAEKFQQVDAKLKQLDAKAQPAPQSTPPEVQDFVERNSTWFQKDKEATAWAINRADELARQGLSPAKQVQIVEREAKGLFPEYFEQPKPKAKEAPLSVPGARGSRPAAKGFAALPPEAKKIAADLEARGVGSKEDYARIYFEENGA